MNAMELRGWLCYVMASLTGIEAGNYIEGETLHTVYVVGSVVWTAIGAWCFWVSRDQR